MKSAWKEGLREFSRRLRHAGAVTELRRECDEAVNWADQTLRAVRDRISELESRFSWMWEIWSSMGAPAGLKPHVVYYQDCAAWFMLVGAWFAILLECLIQGGLSVMIFNLPWLWAAVVGIVITLAITFLFKGLFSMALAWYSQNPKRTRDLLVWMIAVLLPIQLVLLAVLLIVVRSFGESSSPLEWLFWPISSLLAITTPVLASALLVGAGLYRWSGELTSEWLELLSTEGKILTLRQHAMTIKPVLVLCVLLLWGSSLHAQRIVAVDVDITDSLEPAERRSALSAVRESLFVSSFRWADELRLTQFSNDAWSVEPYYKVLLPAFHEPECPSVKLNPIQAILKRSLVNGQQSVRLDYNNRLKAETARYETELKGVLSNANTHLVVNRTVRNTCTSFWDLLRRYSKAAFPTRAVVITDGVETCGRTPPRIDKETEYAQLVILLVSTRARSPSASAADEFNSRRNVILTVAPWVKVVPPWSFNSASYSLNRDTTATCWLSRDDQ